MNQLELFEECPNCPHPISYHAVAERGWCEEIGPDGEFCGCYFGKGYDFANLDREKLGRGLSRTTDMPTSVQAGQRKEASGTGETDGAIGLAVLKTGNFTDLEVANILEWGDPSKWGRRRVELARIGIIRLTGEKRNGSAVWKLRPGI